MSEKPVHPRPRRLVDWINPAGAKKVHSLIDKVYTRKNLEMAWERVKANPRFIALCPQPCGCRSFSGQPELF